MAGVLGDSVASAWQSLPGGHIQPGMVAGGAEAPAGREAVQLSAAHQALCNYQRALMVLDTLHWGLI